MFRSVFIPSLLLSSLPALVLYLAETSLEGDLIVEVRVNEELTLLFALCTLSMETSGVSNENLSTGFLVR